MCTEFVKLYVQFTKMSIICEEKSARASFYDTSSNYTAVVSFSCSLLFQQLTQFALIIIDRNLESINSRSVNSPLENNRERREKKTIFKINFSVKRNSFLYYIYTFCVELRICVLQ